MRRLVTIARGVGRGIGGKKSPKSRDASPEQTKILDKLAGFLDKAGFDVKRYGSTCEVPGLIIFTPHPRNLGLTCDAQSREILDIEDDIQDQLDDVGDNTGKPAMGSLSYIADLLKDATSDVPALDDDVYIVTGAIGKRKMTLLAIIRGDEVIHSGKRGFERTPTKEFMTMCKNCRFEVATKDAEYAINLLANNIVKSL